MDKNSFEEKLENLRKVFPKFDVYDFVNLALNTNWF